MSASRDGLLWELQRRVTLAKSAGHELVFCETWELETLIRDEVSALTLDGSANGTAQIVVPTPDETAKYPQPAIVFGYDYEPGQGEDVTEEYRA